MRHAAFWCNRQNRITNRHSGDAKSNPLLNRLEVLQAVEVNAEPVFKNSRCFPSGQLPTVDKARLNVPAWAPDAGLASVAWR